MRPITAFGRFWSKLVLGDDWSIAAAVVWSLILIHKLTAIFVNVWYLLPALVILLLGSTVAHGVRGASKHEGRLIIPAWAGLFLPVLTVLLVPVVVFRLAAGDSTLVDLFFPLAVNTLAGVIIAVIAGWIYRYRSFGGSLVAMILAVAWPYTAANTIQTVSERLNVGLPAVAFCFMSVLLVMVAGVIAVMANSRSVRPAKR